MRHLKPSTILLVLALALVVVIGTACGSTEGAVGPQGAKGDKGDQGEPGPAGPSMIVAMAQVNADGSRGESYNVDAVTWDSANRRYVIKLTGINYTYTTFVTIVTAGYSNYTATYAEESGNMIVALTNTAGTRQQDHFSFMVLRAP